MESAEPEVEQEDWQPHADRERRPGDGRVRRRHGGAAGVERPAVALRRGSHRSAAGLPDSEIFIRAPTQMLGYFDTEGSPIDAEGWLHTGDLGRLDDDGHLWITGRAKDMIIRGGENIAPVAVERALSVIPGVVEVAVIGVPDPDLGEEVMAFVVVEAEPSAGELDRRLRGLATRVQADVPV